MASKFKFLLLYFLAWVLFFELMRVAFMLYHLDKTQELSFSTIMSALWYGLRMDLSVAAYLLAPVCLFVLASLIIPFFRRALIYKIYTFIVFLVIFLITFIDLEVYGQWGFRIDSTPLKFLSTPREALASVSHLPLLLLLAIFIVCFGAFYWLFQKTIQHIFFDRQQRYRILTAILILLFTASLIIPVRGGLQLAPLNQSSVYFSTNNYANHAAINASWNFLHSLTSKGSSGRNPYQYMPVDLVKKITDSLYAGNGANQVVIRRTGQPINIIFLIWESFTEKTLGLAVDGKEVTPHFNSLKGEGLFFSNVYASGDRTNKGIPAILSGYPALPNTTIIHSPGKSQKIQVLSKLFKEKGYATPFFYGGEPEFANIKSYLLYGGYEPIIGKDDFDAKEMNSKWGAHDGVVMRRVLDDLNQTKQPFFATWLTLTSHEPFETPVPPAFAGNDNTTKFLNSIHYTDQVVFDFITECRKQSWWQNTLLVITGDHGHPLPESPDKANDFRIPMLWLGGALVPGQEVVSKVVSQLDIAATLSSQLGMDRQIFPFSKNVLDSSGRQWAFFTFNNGFGFIDSTGRLVYDNVGKRPIHQEGGVGASQVEAGRAMMQYVYDDFLKK